MNELTCFFEVEEAVAQTVIKSLQVELSQEKHERSTVEISYDERLRLDIKTKDLHAMRASVNTYLRWVDMSLKLIQDF